MKCFVCGEEGLQKSDIKLFERRKDIFEIFENLPLLITTQEKEIEKEEPYAIMIHYADTQLAYIDKCLMYPREHGVDIVVVAHHVTGRALEWVQDICKEEGWEMLDLDQFVAKYLKKRSSEKA